MNNDNTETTIIDVPVEKINSTEQTVFDDSTTKFEEITPPIIEPKEISASTIGNYTTKSISELMSEKATKNFDIQTLLNRLKYKYPERFTPERIEESVDYVLAKFDLSKIFQGDSKIIEVEANLYW